MKRILIIDDESPIAEMIADFCQALGFETRVIKEGEDIMEVVKSYSPSLITLDLIMPEVSGLEVLEILKMDEETKAIPVIIISSIAKNITPNEILAKSRALLQKPVTLDTLREKIENALSLSS